MDLYGNSFHVAAVECDFEFGEVIEQEKKELLRRLLDVYFKDEPTVYDLIKDDDKWEEYFGQLAGDEDAKDLFEEHYCRQLTHRYAGTLYGKTTVKPDLIVRQIALFIGTYFITQYIKSEPYLTPEDKMKCANTMLKLEIRCLGKDLERREDLCDDLLNEIYRHERKVNMKAAENDELILKNKSRLAKINILKEELRKLGKPMGLHKKEETTSRKAETKSSKDKKKKAEKDKKDKTKEETSSSSDSSDEKSFCGCCLPSI